MTTVELEEEEEDFGAEQHSAKLIRISEIFGPTIQGEGRLIGTPTVFVRTGGCDYRCSWCDSLHAVLPEHRKSWKPTTVNAIIAEVDRLAGGPILITISGGNPALQPLAPLIAVAHLRGHRVALETQGSVCRAWMQELDHMCVSPKPPSSGMHTDFDKLADVLQVAPHDVLLKVVVFDETDYWYAREVAKHFPSVPFAISAGNADVTSGDDALVKADILERTRWLIEFARADRWYDLTILPQLHVLLWGNARAV